MPALPFCCSAFASPPPLAYGSYEPPGGKRCKESQERNAFLYAHAHVAAFDISQPAVLPPMSTCARLHRACAFYDTVGAIHESPAHTPRGPSARLPRICASYTAVGATHESPARTRFLDRGSTNPPPPIALTPGVWYTVPKEKEGPRWIRFLHRKGSASFRFQKA